MPGLVVGQVCPLEITVPSGQVIGVGVGVGDGDVVVVVGGVLVDSELSATSWWLVHPPWGIPAPLMAVPSPMSPLEQLRGPLMQVACQVAFAFGDQA